MRAALGAVAGILLSVAAGPAAPPAPSAPASASEAAVVFFESKVRPVLAEHCYSCHGDKKQKGGLRLDSRAAALAGGDQGPALVAGQPDASLLVQAVRHDGDLKMPPKSKLPREQADALARWVALGAPWPGDSGSSPAAPRRGDKVVTDKDREHWAFQPVRPVAPPTVRDAAWPLNPVDTFVLAGLEAKGLAPNPPASRRELIRRLSYDLTGLPPTPAEAAAFESDDRPDAYERLVDRLLDSPHYGEKWGRHWLDLVRFAETNSYERDNPKPHAWRYRDYVIRAFNEDKPYDRFLTEQLAGDELPDGGPDGLVATGFYRLGIWDDEPTDREQAKFDGLDDILTTTGQAFLGLTLDCARCHEHKIDPVPQRDYYRLLAFFHNVNPFHNGGRTDEAPIPGGTALCVTEAGPRAPDTYVLLRGSPQNRGDRVSPGFPQVLGAPDPVLPMPAPGARTTGRRSVLAGWIASGDNPLTARVMVNRVWHHHFGRGLVRSLNNFGLQGDRPTHPELLDWLAGRFVRDGWRLKLLHRLLVTSRTYRMSSSGRPEALAADPTNDLLWRFDMRRLTAEELRDSLLTVCGRLNSKMYGPGIYPEIPREVLAGQSVPGKGWGKSSPAEQARRSIYIHVKRSLLTPILESFDVAETDRTAPVRFATTQPTQALALLNSTFLNRQAGVLAERLRREAGDDTDARVRLALMLTTGREPSAAEVDRGAALIASLKERDGLPPEEALRLFCLTALNLNEFLYLD